MNVISARSRVVRQAQVGFEATAGCPPTLESCRPVRPRAGPRSRPSSAAPEHGGYCRNDTSRRVHECCIFHSSASDEPTPPNIPLSLRIYRGPGALQRGHHDSSHLASSAVHSVHSRWDHAEVRAITDVPFHTLDRSEDALERCNDPSIARRDAVAGVVLGWTRSAASDSNGGGSRSCTGARGGRVDRAARPVGAPTTGDLTPRLVSNRLFDNRVQITRRLLLYTAVISSVPGRHFGP